MSEPEGDDVARRLIPPDVMAKIRSAGESARQSHHDDARRFRAMPDNELLDTTKIMMRNLDRVDEGPDRTLRAVLVPECWERIRPGTRDELRSIITSLAEWSEEAKSNLTIALRSHIGPDGIDRIRGESRRIREAIDEASRAEPLQLIEQMLFLISGTRAYQGEGRLPTDPVYEPAFAYRLVPEIARRMLEREGRQG